MLGSFVDLVETLHDEYKETEIERKVKDGQKTAWVINYFGQEKTIIGSTDLQVKDWERMRDIIGPLTRTHIINYGILIAQSSRLATRENRAYRKVSVS